MKEAKFKKLVKKDKYQVFLLSTHLPIPLSFAVHTWFVAVNKGKLERWDVWDTEHVYRPSWRHLHLRSTKASVGLNVFPLLFAKKLRWNSKLIYYIEGDENSVAHKMCKFLHSIPKEYPFNDFYRFVRGPNSNTFTQWIIDKFPEDNFKLPWNAFGKNYKY